MARVIGIGNQDFEKIRVNNNFYIDKTAFIREWWEAARLSAWKLTNREVHADEKELSDTVCNALRQIDEKDYQSGLIVRGIPKERIRKYGFAFCGKKVLIGKGREL